MVKEVVEKSSSESVKSKTEKRDSLVKLFHENRLSIEAKINDITPIEITSKYFRAKVKQKWSKIHVYTEGGKVLRIKSYPYESISDRTEEFYFYEGQLATVVMENDGEWTQTQDESKLDKVFYFDNGMLIHETGGSSPYDSVENMGSELTQEAIEYNKLYNEALARMN